MCAIAGVIKLPVNEAVIEKILVTMHRRGPDEQGVFRNHNTALLHSRLTIVDPEGGKQPMILNWAGEEYILVYNGELYNTSELRGMLIKAGHRFLGHSDTEVVLHAYAEYGEECVHKLNGIFAFAVLERKQKRLFLARDRIGVKPLFYKLHNGGLLFSSEIKTLLSYPGVKAQLDDEGAVQLIMLGPGRTPGSGILKGIKELEPGCFGYFLDDTLSVTRYWKLRDREHRENFEQTSEHVRFLVEDAIKRQMVSDVPLGTLLSGGLDSSIITAVCAKESEKSGCVLPSFSVDYLNNDQYFCASKFQPDADDRYIDLMTEYLNTCHTKTVLTADNLIEALPEATIARDLPGMADVDFSLILFAKEIRNKVKVVLSGECADEIFGGYPWFRDPDIRMAEGFPWAQNTAQREALLKGNIGITPAEYIMDEYRKTCIESDVLPGTSDLERRMKEMVNLNFRWFMQTLLDRKDRMSMYYGLEVRVPFCDFRIAEYMYGVPWSFKDYQGREKGLLRHAVKDLLPDAVRYRKKSPYPKTFDPAYETAAEERLSALVEDNAQIWHLIDKKQVKKMMTTESKWPWYGQLMRKAQTFAYFLQIDFWLKHYNVEFCF